MRTAFDFLLVAAASYALSFSFDLGFGAMLGVYPDTAYLPAITWQILGLVGGGFGFLLAPTARFLVGPP